MIIYFILSSLNFLDMAFFTYSQDKSSNKYKCPYCPYATNYSSHLQAHKRKHTGERPYKCDICAKAFTQKTTLVNHYRSHTGERPFSCVHCKKGFSQKVHLKLHKCLSNLL